MVKTIVAIMFIFACTTGAWFALGGAMAIRTEDQDQTLRSSVRSLWGQEQHQEAPVLHYQKTETQSTQVVHDNKSVTETKEVTTDYPATLESTNVNVDLDLEHRKKGLLWYSTYRVNFAGEYGFSNETATPSDYLFEYKFPSTEGIYDSFTVEINGAASAYAKPEAGVVTSKIRLQPNEKARIRISYRSQGLDEWWYAFGKDVEQVRNFQLNINTNYEDINFPDESMSPTSKTQTEIGWQLTWKYSNLLSGSQIAMKMPQKINPGPFVARVSFFAPVSLFLFFFLIFIIATLKSIKIHPMNYFFLAAGFFSFHLLMAYLADHVDIGVAFAISSIVSIALVLSYMRLVVGARFALVETGLSQLVYLVLFSYAFFLEGYTGLTISITCIITLFVVMMATGRVNWSEVFRASATKTSGA